MKDLFVIQNISPFYSSYVPDSPYLLKDMEKYKGINCTISLKKVIDPVKMTVEEESVYMHHGNTNPKVIKCFSNFVNGIKKVHGERNGIARETIFLDSDKIVKGAIVEIQYTSKVESSKKHIVPTDVAKFVGYAKKIKKTEDKVTRLF